MIMVALQRSYLGQRLYRTVTGRGFSTTPTSLGRWRWPLFAAVLLLLAAMTLLFAAMLVLTVLHP